MGLIEATETCIVRKVNGQDATFTFLTAYDRAELLRADLDRRQAKWREKRERLIANLKTAGIEREQMFAELQAFEDSEPVDVDEQNWFDFVNNPLNEVAIYALSLRAVHGDQADSIARQTLLTLADKAKICGLVVVQKKDEAAPATSGENPFVTPATGVPMAYGPMPTISTGPPPAAGSSTISPA